MRPKKTGNVCLTKGIKEERGSSLEDDLKAELKDLREKMERLEASKAASIHSNSYEDLLTEPLEITHIAISPGWIPTKKHAHNS